MLDVAEHPTRGAEGPADRKPPFPFVDKRDGRSVPYDRGRIARAIEKAFRAELDRPDLVPLDASIRETVEALTDAVEVGLAARAAGADRIGIESIQDEVERQLMATGHYSVARRYVLYREARARARAMGSIRVREADGRESLLDRAPLRAMIEEAAAGLGDAVDVEGVYRDLLAALYDGVTRKEIGRAAVMAARARTEREPEYAYLAARLLLTQLYAEALAAPVALHEMARLYSERFEAYLRRGVQAELLDPALLEFDLPRLAAALRPERDLSFALLGLQTLYDRYLLHEDGTRFELPQWFWMRVAMGLALAERPEERDTRAIEFYEVLSTFLFCSSTPTLFNAGTRHPQLSSCFLTTVQDDLGEIFKAIRDDALLSKWSGGIGNDWTPVRALGAHIRGTNGKSQGVIPFLKVANDTAVAVNQGGKRQGAICAYLETWHLDIEEFLDLRKNTGDERRRTHDMHTAHWIPDLFMKRVREDATWTLFSPDEVRDLHDLYGRAFEKRYEEYEAMADAGQIRLFRRVRAVDLWRRMLAMLFETGHPWLTWKDPANIRSPQDHVGVIHSSNLCTEILLNTSREEVAVCNLGSVNLAAHVGRDGLDADRLARTVATAVRMLDNVIDINLYPIPEARASNLRHRPIGLGIMGFQDALFELGISFASEAAVEFADESMELVAYHAILASARLAAERGRYPSYEGSKWDRGLLPIDTIDLLEAERGVPVRVERGGRLDWTPVREAIAAHGMRNSNVLAIAPTATISNICGVTQSIEPIYKNLYVKSNLSGEFTVLNPYLVADLRARGLWDAELVEELKYHDGSVAEIARVPDDLKERYRTAFEIEPEWLIRCAARRQKWIDMAQSLNLYLDRPSGRRLSEMYQVAWESGLKTTYYLRTTGASGIEASTVDINRFGIQPRWMKSVSPSASIRIERAPAVDPNRAPAPSCDTDGACEACQ